LNFLDRFWKNPQIPRFIKIVQWDGRTDRQTDLTKLIVGIRNFAKVPKKIHLIIV